MRDAVNGRSVCEAKIIKGDDQPGCRGQSYHVGTFQGSLGLMLISQQFAPIIMLSKSGDSDHELWMIKD